MLFKNAFFLDKFQNIHNGERSKLPLNNGFPKISSVMGEQTPVLQIYVYLILREGKTTAVSCRSA